jgi:hypothetical protein
MKKRVLFVIFITLLFSISFIAAQENATDTSINQINNAYDCLKSKVVGKCDSLSIEDKIFSLLAIGECQSEVMADSLSKEAWPKTNPKLKTTAQAILALDKTTIDTTQAEEWLISRTTSPEDVVWYLQIESSEETICKITDSGGDYKLTLREDKTLSSDAGICLDLTSDEFWLKVSPGCFDEEFEISCDKDFQTSLVFQRKTSSILHVSSQTNPASANGITTEKIKSSCFMESGGECDYEGSLWAALILDYKGHDISDYMPYLLTMAEENPKYLPESFLYLLTAQDDYKNTLRLRQKAGKYWEETGDKFYDTAVALFSISDEPIEKINTMNWLLEIQGNDGCFPTTVRNNAFLLASIWPRSVDPTVRDCVGSGYYCGSEASCEQEDLLLDYECTGVYVCCRNPPEIKSCSEQLGDICTSEEQCVGGTTTDASDLSPFETCCIGGRCEIPTPLSDCEKNFGECVISCGTGEIQADYDCTDFGDICCVVGEEKASLWWIWVLIILIILVVLGIIFRKRVRTFFRKGPKPFLAPRPRPRPGMPPGIARRPLQRRIIPPQKRPPVPRPAKKPGELSDVLKRLKEISK